MTVLVFNKAGAKIPYGVESDMDDTIRAMVHELTLIASFQAFMPPTIQKQFTAELAHFLEDVSDVRDRAETYYTYQDDTEEDEGTDLDDDYRY